MKHDRVVLSFGVLNPIAEKVKEVADMAKVLVGEEHYREILNGLDDVLAEVAVRYAEAEGFDGVEVAADAERGLIMIALKGEAE